MSLTPADKYCAQPSAARKYVPEHILNPRVVLIAHVTGISNSVTLNAAAVYFYARAAHAGLHLLGISFLMARTVVFTVAWCAFIAFAFQLF